MGQYWKVVNFDKREYVTPYKLGSGLKLWEQLANHPSTGEALIILCAAMPVPRGGGDFDMEDNWHGADRVPGITPGPDLGDYSEIAKRTIGRWAGDRIALVGDYAKDDDIPDYKGTPLSAVYRLCEEPEYAENDIERKKLWTDISDDVARVIEHELAGKYVGDGWREFQTVARGDGK